MDRIRAALPALLGSFDHVSTLFDFYGFKRRNQRGIHELENAITELVDVEHRRRLIPYLQQYEFEALLFAVPQQAVEWLQGSARQLAEMQNAVLTCGSPEQVNDSPETSPSHRLENLFPGYDKKLHGPDIIELSGLAKIRQECPRFDAWLSRLENLD